MLRLKIIEMLNHALKTWDNKLNVFIGDKLGLSHHFTDLIIKKLVEEGSAPDPRVKIGVHI